MPKLALWAVEGDHPARLPEYDLLEKHLETWVENDGALVLDGVRWVGRQLTLPSRGRLDLLGITPQGQWVVAELKSGPVDLSALHQALGYAMEIFAMDRADLLARLDQEKHPDLSQYVEDRLLTLLLVGTSQAPDLERGIGFLAERGLDLPIRVVTFGLFKQPNGSVLLARQIEEREASEEPKVGAGIQRVLDIARIHGVFEEVTETTKLAERLGLPLKVWPAAITINSPLNKRKTLIYVGPREGGCRVGYAADTYAEVFGSSEADVIATLGTNWVTLPKADVPAWIRKVEDFTRALQARQATE